jgi:hypothetical protein
MCVLPCMFLLSCLALNPKPILTLDYLGACDFDLTIVSWYQHGNVCDAILVEGEF